MEAILYERIPVPLAREFMTYGSVKPERPQNVSVMFANIHRLRHASKVLLSAGEGGAVESVVQDEDGHIRAGSANPDVPGIEARGIGILRPAQIAHAKLGAVMDLAQAETARLPPQDRKITVLSQQYPLLFRSEGPQFAAALVIYLRTTT